jgi:hypothetical protein
MEITAGECCAVVPNWDELGPIVRSVNCLALEMSRTSFERDVLGSRGAAAQPIPQPPQRAKTGLTGDPGLRASPSQAQGRGFGMVCRGLWILS